MGSVKGSGRQLPPCSVLTQIRLGWSAEKEHEHFEKHRPSINSPSVGSAAMMFPIAILSALVSIDP